MTARTEPITCQRCGIEFTLTVQALQQRKAKAIEKPDCLDCETLNKPIRPTHNTCRPWGGEVDDEFRPLRYGKLYRPGVRTCGRVDCVKGTHIIPEPKPEKPQRSPVRRSKTVSKPKPVIIPKAVIKPPKEPKPVKLPKSLIEALEAERWDQTYRGEPKRTLKQLKKAVELERYRIPPR